MAYVISIPTPAWTAALALTLAPLALLLPASNIDPTNETAIAVAPLWCNRNNFIYPCPTVMKNNARGLVMEFPRVMLLN